MRNLEWQGSTRFVPHDSAAVLTLVHFASESRASSHSSEPLVRLRFTAPTSMYRASCSGTARPAPCPASRWPRQARAGVPDIERSDIRVWFVEVQTRCHGRGSCHGPHRGRRARHHHTRLGGVCYQPFRLWNDSIAHFTATLVFLNYIEFQLKDVKLSDTKCDGRSVYADLFDQNGKFGTYSNSKGAVAPQPLTLCTTWTIRGFIGCKYTSTRATPWAAAQLCTASVIQNAFRSVFQI